MNHTPGGTQGASPGPGTGTPAGDPAGAAGAASAPGTASVAPVALLAVDAAGEVLAAWERGPHDPRTPLELTALVTFGGCVPADPARWQVYDLALDPAAVTEAPRRRDPALAVSDIAGAEHRARLEAAGFPGFPLHLDGADGDDPARPWRLVLPGGTVRDFPDWAEAVKSVGATPGPFAFYERQPDTGTWHRTELIRGDTRCEVFPAELPPGPEDDPADPWRVIGPHSHGDYASRSIAYTVLRAMPAGPACVYVQKTGAAGWKRYEMYADPAGAQR